MRPGEEEETTPRGQGGERERERGGNRPTEALGCFGKIPGDIVRARGDVREGGIIGCWRSDIIGDMYVRWASG